MTRNALFALSIILVVTLASPLLAQSNPDTAVWTDKGNYLPGEVVTVTGVGFQPGEVINLVFHVDGREDRTSTANADENGGFTNNAFSPDSLDAQATIKLIATGTTSGFEAVNYFLDDPAPSCANGFTVDPVNGNSAGPVFQTIQQAVNSLPNPGPCVVTIKAGTYPEHVIITGRNSAASSDSQRVVFRRDPAASLGSVVVSSATLTGQNKQQPFLVQTSKFITIHGLTISGGSAAGVSIAASSSDITIVASDITGNSDGVGISASLPRIWVVNNLIHGNSGVGVQISGPNSTSPFVVNNTIYSNGNHGIAAPSSAQIAVINNLVIANGGFGIQQTGTPTPAAATLKNNMFYKNTTGDIGSSILDASDSGNYTGAGTGTGVAGCTFTDCLSTHTTSAIQDATGHLVAASPALDKGLNSFVSGVERVPSTDIDGDARPVNSTVDIGADERKLTTPPPIPTITGKPDNPSNQTSATFTFTDTDSTATFECELDGDGSAYTPCSSPKAYASLADGSHTFRVRAKNIANLTSDPAVYTWVIDTALPVSTASVTSGTAGDNGWYKSNVEVTITASKPNGTIKQIVYAVNGGTAVTVNGSTATVNVTTEGTTTITYHSVDTLGNVEATNTFTVKIDKTAPTATLAVTAGTLGKNGWYTSNVTLHATGTDANPVTCDPDLVVSTETAGHEYKLTCTDEAGWSTETNGITIKLDKSGPTAELKVESGTIGANNWYTTDVTLSASGTDDISGPVTCSPETQSVTTETTGQQVNATCENSAGLQTNATPLTIKLDKTAPNATLAVTAGNKGKNDWYISDVTLHATGTDTISEPVVCDQDTSVTTETAGTSYKLKCTNNAGLSADTNSINIKLDKSGPTAELNVTAGTAGTNGWFTSDVTVTASGTDSISGPVTCSPETQSVTTETTGQVLSAKCENEAGLETNATPLTIKLDKSAPNATLAVTAGTQGNNGWYTSDVTLHATGTDSISEPVVCDQDTAVTTETAGTSYKLKCTNNAGLSADTNSINIKLDKTGPTAQLNVTSGTLGSNGWYITDVTVAATGSDTISGPVTCTPATQSVTAETTGQVLNAKCENEAGLETSATPLTIKLDKADPVIVLASRLPAANSFGWNNSSVTVTWNCTDAISGPVSPTSFAVVANEAASQTANGSCSDNAGRTSVASVGDINIDKTAPVLSPTVTPTPVVLNGPATAADGATDALAGIATHGCTQPDSSSVGLKTLTCTATDKAGNTVGPTNVSYSVQYLSAGACMGNLGHSILQPVDADGSSVFKQKSTVPAKFRVCDANGASIGTAGVVSTFRLVGTMTGTASQVVDEEVFSTTPDTTFRWDPTSAQWIFNMNTKSLSANVTYIYRITLNDSTTIDYRFGLK